MNLGDHSLATSAVHSWLLTATLNLPSSNAPYFPLFYVLYVCVLMAGAQNIDPSVV
jgi:hypothetical protein